jgi:hypothetical protein
LVSNQEIKGEAFRRGIRQLDTNRVTGLGEFSHKGLLFTLDLFSKILKVAKILGLLFHTVQVLY